MKKVFFLLILGFFLATPQSLQAVDESGRFYQCFPKFKLCNEVNGDGKSTGNNNASCEPIDNDEVHKSESWWHRVQLDLTTFSFPPNSDFIVVECTDVLAETNPDNPGLERVCTTGDSPTDRELFCGDRNDTSPGCDGLKILEQDSKNYDITGGTKGIFHLKNGKYERATNLKIPTDQNGKSTIQRIEWERSTDDGKRIISSFHVAYFKPPITPTPTSEPGVSPGVGGQQQAVLTFPQLTSTTNDGCFSKSWDPYGKVFDAVSLEPIPNPSVELHMQGANGTFSREEANSKNTFIVNPFPASEGGDFNFFVVDGLYKLFPSVNGYSHPSLASRSQVNQNVLSIYSDLFFSDSPAIVQQGAIVHRDIPMMPTDGVGKNYPVKLFYEDPPERLADGKLRLEGAVSHPYAEVTVETCKQENGTEVCNNPQIYNHTNGGPDNLGEYSIILDQKLLNPGEYYKRTTIDKVDLTALKLSSSPIDTIMSFIFDYIFPKEVFAQENSIPSSVIEPVPSYIEGYAYDSNGDIMPNATVNIMTDISRLPVMQVQANSQGYYKLTSENLPTEEYTIQYIDQNSGAASSVSTSRMMQQNREFILTERINPYLVTTASTDPRKDITPSFVPPQTVSAVSDQNSNINNPEVTEPTVATTSSTTNNSFVLIGVILLLLVATAGTLIGVYLYRKKMRGDEEME